MFRISVGSVFVKSTLVLNSQVNASSYVDLFCCFSPPPGKAMFQISSFGESLTRAAELATIDGLLQNEKCSLGWGGMLTGGVCEVIFNSCCCCGCGS